MSSFIKSFFQKSAPVSPKGISQYAKGNQYPLNYPRLLTVQLIGRIPNATAAHTVTVGGIVRLPDIMALLANPTLAAFGGAAYPANTFENYVTFSVGGSFNATIENLSIAGIGIVTTPESEVDQLLINGLDQGIGVAQNQLTPLAIYCQAIAVAQGFQLGGPAGTVAPKISQLQLPTVPESIPFSDIAFTWSNSVLTTAIRDNILFVAMWVTPKPDDVPEGA